MIAFTLGFDAAVGLIEVARWRASQNQGFEAASQRDGNVGYLDLWDFYPRKETAAVAAGTMAMQAVTSPKIIDPCNKRSGLPETVAYRCCLFFPASTPIKLNDIHNQITDETGGFWTEIDRPLAVTPMTDTKWKGRDTA